MRLMKWGLLSVCGKVSGANSDTEIENVAALRESDLMGRGLRLR